MGGLSKGPVTRKLVYVPIDGAPGLVSNFDVVVSDFNTLTVQYMGHFGVSYSITLRTPSGKTVRRVVSMSNSNEMKAGKLTGLKDDNTYIVQISASNEHGRGPMSIKEVKLPGKAIPGPVSIKTYLLTFTTVEIQFYSEALTSYHLNVTNGTGHTVHVRELSWKDGAGKRSVKVNNL